MALSLSATGAYFYMIEQVDPGVADISSWVPLVSLVIFIIGYSVGFASLPFVLMGELLPSRYRDSLGGIASRLVYLEQQKNSISLLTLFIAVSIYSKTFLF
jgi:facilitated trehalose transporter